MKKIWKKYRGIIIVILSVFAFVLLSIFCESLGTQKLDEFKTGFVKDEYSVSVLALTTCTHCHNLNPIIKEITEEYDLPLYWVNYDKLSSKNKNYLYEMLEPYGFSGYFPFVIISKKGEVIDTHLGEMTKEEALSFLKDSEVIK